ncbi:MAG: hypothetical protein ACI8XO_004890 [Verrucomicrobiales bacterium]|jgi:hypothetical protein
MKGWEEVGSVEELGVLSTIQGIARGCNRNALPTQRLIPVKRTPRPFRLSTCVSAATQLSSFPAQGQQDGCSGRQLGLGDH